MVSGPLRWMSENPLRTAGIVATLVATLYVVVASAPADGSATAAVPTAIAPSAVVAFAISHPAYPVIAVVGVLTFVLLD